ncbi:MAG: DUF4251 domain-containing protein [Bacteroidales bacterium]|nr:DUF4251 domain-containing protein [Bacteroidales bacterium]
MKKIILSIIMVLAVGISAIAQENTDTSTRKLSKKEQKELEKKKKAQEDSIAHADAVEAINNGVYILIVDKTMNKVIHEKDRRFNFIIVENDKILIQTGSELTYGGNNNLGGITIISNIVGDIKTEEKKNGQVNSKFRVIDEYLSGDVKVKLNKKSNYGEISVLDLKTGQNAIFLGYFLPFSQQLVGEIIEIGKLFTPQGWDAFSLGKKRDVGSLMDYLTGAR